MQCRGGRVACPPHAHWPRFSPPHPMVRWGGVWLSVCAVGSCVFGVGGRVVGVRMERRTAISYQVGGGLVCDKPVPSTLLPISRRLEQSWTPHCEGLHKTHLLPATMQAHDSLSARVFGFFVFKDSSVVQLLFIGCAIIGLIPGSRGSIAIDNNLFRKGTSPIWGV